MGKLLFSFCYRVCRGTFTSCHNEDLEWKTHVFFCSPISLLMDRRDCSPRVIAQATNQPHLDPDEDSRGKIKDPPAHGRASRRRGVQQFERDICQGCDLSVTGFFHETMVILKFGPKH